MRPKPDPSIHIALAHHTASRLKEAESILRQILNKNPTHPDALHILGIISIQTNRLPDGIALLRKATEVMPNNAQFHHNLGKALRDAGHTDAAITAGRRAVQIRPDYAEAHNNLGGALRDKGKIDEALAAFSRAIQLKPDLALAHKNLADALHDKNQFDQSIASYRRAIQLAPNFAEAFNNLGLTLREYGKFDEAILAFRQALQLMPQSPQVHSNLANALCDNGQLDEGIAAFRQTLRLTPDFADARSTLGLRLLLQGNFPEGWRECEARQHRRDFRLPPLNVARPRWDGNDLNGQTILLQSEQGIGDTIQFIRYAPLVAARDGRVIVQAHASLVRLLKSNPDLGQIISTDETLPPFDVHCPMLSLPMLFATDLQSIPAPIPYLKADEQLTAAWAQRIGPTPGKFRVGMTWAGNPQYAANRTRSIPLEIFMPLMSVKNVSFFSLQKTKPAKQNPPPAFELIDYTSDLTDFADTAALIASLDLVISVDTAVAHLAGALAKPAWVLLPFAPDWRWLLERQDSPWYPTLRLFRQKTLGNWSDVIAQIAEALTELRQKS